MERTCGLWRAADATPAHRWSRRTGCSFSPEPCKAFRSTDLTETPRTAPKDELRDAVLLVFANKHDLPHAMTVEEVAEKLGLHRLGQLQFFIEGSCATTGVGLYEGLARLSHALSTAK